MNKNKKEFSFPPEEEMEKVIKRFSDPNYNRVNIGLMPDASELDKSKYNICQSISHYKRINKLTSEELTKKLEINQEKTEDILFGRVAKLDLESLVYLTEKLEIRIIEPTKFFLSTTPPFFYASRSS